MKQAALAVALAVVTASGTLPLRAQLPDTPAGRQLSGWLEAFNSGDRARIMQFLQANYPTRNIDAEVAFRTQTGGFDFRKIEQSSPTSATGLVQERGGDTFARFTLEVEAAEPHRIIHLALQVVPRPPEFALPPMTEAEVITALKAKLEKDVAEDRFAGAVLVGRVQDGRSRVVFGQAYGLADREKKIANTLDTRFRIGSMNKMFTATAILRLAQAGKLELNAPLGKYLPDYPNQNLASKVTIHHLLTHTGGTGDIFGPDFDAHRLELRALNDYVELYGKRDLQFEPGSRWAYSNYGMLLLGVVIERVSGQSYYDYVADHIFKPAGMTGSGSEPEDVAVNGRSVGYMWPRGSASWATNTSTLPYRGTSAGGGYSTVNDLLKFGAALLGHELLDAEYTNLLITGKADTGGGRMYAYGFMDARKDGAGWVGHGGGAPGMNGELRINPTNGYVVAVLSNLDPPAATRQWSFLETRLPR
jgi:CubicO group peptidase (beta-lactamase class C family)